MEEPAKTLEDQAYSALGKWIERLCIWVYRQKQKAKSKQSSQLVFEAGALAETLNDIRQEMLDGERTPEEAMGALHNPEIRAIIDECLKKGM